MIEQLKEAKNKKQTLHLKNFHQSKITWQDALDFVYSESKNERILDNYNGYFFLQDANLFMFDQVKEFMDKINGKPDSDKCVYYQSPGQIGRKCNCDKYWHIQTLRVSITNHFIPNHSDPYDVLYWQLLGTSTWTINDSIVYTLHPGDLLYFNKGDLHSIIQDGPRAGIIIDGGRRF